MYPFKKPLSETLVCNEWYVVGTSAEFTHDTLLARTILGRPVVLFRDPDGKAVMMDGSCPHRNFPLGRGSLVDGEVRCGYHGIRFDPTGTCTFVPGAPKPSRHLKVRSYPVVERAGWVWSWTGDPASADESSLPALGRPEIDEPSWHHLATSHYSLIGARYTLLLENLMDLSHLSYLHGDVIRDTTIADRRLDVEDGEESLLAIRRMTNSAIGFVEATLYGAQPGVGAYDYDNKAEYFSPSLVITGQEPWEGSPEGFGAFYFVHAVTPETETTTHYWVHEARDFAVGDERAESFFAQARAVIPFQDKEALELIEPVPDSIKFTERSQHFDRGALLMRARIARRLLAEQQAAEAATERARPANPATLAR